MNAIMSKTILVVIILLNYYVAYSAGDEPWEPQDIADIHSISQRLPTQEGAESFIYPLTSFLIAGYQSNASTTSVHRCPYYLSCSNFALVTIKRYGIVGFCMFIDRYFYRENAALRRYYPLRAKPDGTLKADDTFFTQLCEHD